MTHWIVRFICILTLTAFGAPLYAGTIKTLWHVPASEIYNEDRVDIHWTFTPGVDSIQVNFEDGETVTISPDQDTLRHIYRDSGRFDLTLTIWEAGESTVFVESNFMVVQQRPVPGENFMFVHHSTGRNLMRDSGVRSLLQLHKDRGGTAIELWDHDYHSDNTYTGIIEPDSTVHPGWSYGQEANNIQPSGYYEIFCNGSAFRDSLFNRHDVIVLKNDHSTGDIVSDTQLASYQSDYLQIRDVLDLYPEKRFILVSGPPRRPEDISNAEADRARAFYDWLQGPEFMNGHPHISFYDLFDLLAYPDTATDPERNMLRSEYQRPYTMTDSHPNEYANSVIGPQFASMLIRVVDPSWINEVTSTPGAVTHLRLHPNHPNPFNPSTAISYDLERPGLTCLDIFDLSGKRIRSILTPTMQEPGHYTLRWNGLDDGGRALSSGVYLYRLTSGTETTSRRMVLIR